MKKRNNIVLALASYLCIYTVAYAGGEIKHIAPATDPQVNIPLLDEPKDFYIGLGAGVGKVNSHFYGKDTVTDMTLKAGYNIYKNIAIEARGTFGVSDGDQLSHDYSIGLYLKPKYSFNDAFGIYGLLGYGQSKITFDNEESFNGIRNNYTKQSGISYGLGLEYKLNSEWSLFTDAVRYIDEKTTNKEGDFAIKIDTVTFGMNYHF